MEDYGFDSLARRAKELRRQRRRNNICAFLATLFILPLCFLAVMVSLRALCREILASETNCNHGSTMYEFMSNIRDENVEVCGEFTLTGEKLFERTDSSPATVEVPTICSTTARVLAVGSVIHVHNHLHDAPFSYEDLRIAGRIGARRIVVVTSEHTYTLCPLGGKWPSEQEVTDFMMPVLDDWSASEEAGLLQIIDDGDSRVLLSTEKLMQAFAYEFGLFFEIS